MSESNRYEFSTFQELFDRVPADRMKDCFREIAAAFEALKRLAEMVDNLTESIHDHPIEARDKAAVQIPVPLVWVDDNKREIKVNLQLADNEEPA